MDDLEVEAVDDVDEDVVPAGVDAPRLVLYGGKGGVGKTTMAAATGLASARDGTPTLVVSTDPAHSLSDALGREVPGQPTRLDDDDPLYGVEIDPEAALEEGGVLGMEGDPLGMGGDGGVTGEEDGAGPMGEGAGPMGGLGDLMGGEGLGEMLGGEDVGELFGGGAMPGADEAAAVRLLLRYVDDERFDRVVVDTAPTGHTLRLLELPEVLDSMVGRVMKIRQRVQGLVEGVKGMFGGDDGPDRGAADLEALREQLEHLRNLLTDPARTDFRIVLVPEEMSVMESRRLRDTLREYDVPVGTVVVNRVMEDLADVAVDVDADWFVAPDLEGCEFCQRRWQVQQRALGEAQELFVDTELRRVPLFADEVRGEEMLRVVAACLD